MIVIGSARNGEKRRRQIDVDGVGFHKSEWLESSQDPVLSPTAFLVEQPPETRLKSHFHGENQFQVFVHGSGSIGRDTILPVTVHYAGAYTGYGPLLSGPDGVFYFTIRAVFETGTKTGVGQMVRGPKRHCVSKPSTPVDAQALKALTTVEEADLIELQPDGVAARILRIPPGAKANGIDPKTGGGQFYMVLGGKLHHGEAVLGRWEMIFVSADEATPALTAGPEGLEVLCLQLAPKDPAYIAQPQATAASVAG